MKPVVCRCVSFCGHTFKSNVAHRFLPSRLKLEDYYKWGAVTVENAVELGYTVMKGTECFMSL
jgi:hypothetical protein